MFLYRHASKVGYSAEPYIVCFVQNLRDGQKIILAKDKIQIHELQIHNVLL